MGHAPQPDSIPEGVDGKKQVNLEEDLAMSTFLAYRSMITQMEKNLPATSA